MRISPIEPGTQPELAALEQQIAAERGRISPLYQVLLNSPPMAHGWEQLLSAVRNRNSLPADLRELVILRVAVLNRAQYEFDAHVVHALKAGVPQTKIDAMRVDGPEVLFTPTEQLALALTDTMTRSIEVPDALYAQVSAAFEPQALVDLMVTIGAYNMVSRFLVALHIGH
jgi:4-carboxymuconolactone decarboxylase